MNLITIKRYLKPDFVFNTCASTYTNTLLSIVSQV